MCYTYPFYFIMNKEYSNPAAQAYYSLNRLSAICTWLFAEDIVIIDNWDKNISIGMNVAQAEQLVQELMIAIAAVRKLEKDLDYYTKSQKDH